MSYSTLEVHRPVFAEEQSQLGPQAQDLPNRDNEKYIVQQELVAVQSDADHGHVDQSHSQESWKKRRLWWIVGGLVLLAVISIAVGVGVGVSSQRNDISSGSKASSTTTPGSPTVSGASGHLSHTTIPASPTLQAIRQRYNVPALAVGHVRSGSLVSAVTGIRKQGDDSPVQNSDIFHLGGITRSLTAILTAKVIEEGTMNWTTTVTDVFGPSLVHEQYSNATVGMLLTDLAGIMPGTDPLEYGDWWTLFRQDAASPTDQRRRFTLDLLSRPPVSTPGSTWQYSLAGYLVLAAMIESHTAQPWQAMMQSLFDKLAMPGCGFGVQPEPSRAAVDNPWPHREPESMGGDPVPVIPDGLHGDNPQALWPAIGVHCDMPSFAAFLRLHLDGYWGRETPILRPSSFQILHSYPTNVTAVQEEHTYAAFDYDATSWNGTEMFTSGSNTLNYAWAWLLLEDDEAFMAFANMGGIQAGNASLEALYAIGGYNVPPI